VELVALLVKELVLLAVQLDHSTVSDVLKRWFSLVPSVRHFSSAWR
jgi:hypothetical protein